MRSIGKLLMLGSMVAVVMAFVVTASAGAWTKEGKQLTEAATVTLNGTFVENAKSIASSVQCDASGEATLFPGSGDGWEVTSFSLDNESCGGTGLYSGCEVVESYVDLNAAELVITFDEECWAAGWTQHGSIAQTFNGGETLTTVSLSGTLTSAGTGPMSVSGTLNVTPSGVYGF